MTTKEIDLKETIAEQEKFIKEMQEFIKQKGLEFSALEKEKEEIFSNALMLKKIVELNHQWLLALHNKDQEMARQISLSLSRIEQDVMPKVRDWK